MDERERRNIETVWRFYRYDREAAAPDLTWHVPGRNPVSGLYHGPEEYFDVLPARMAPLDTWRLAVADVMANDDHAVATFVLTGARKGRRVHLRCCHLFRFNERGQVAEGWDLTSDQDALDAFFSA